MPGSDDHPDEVDDLDVDDLDVDDLDVDDLDVELDDLADVDLDADLEIALDADLADDYPEGQDEGDYEPFEADDVDGEDVAGEGEFDDETVVDVPSQPQELREGEFVCRSCYMAKRESALADPDEMRCRDCA